QGGQEERDEHENGAHARDQRVTHRGWLRVGVIEQESGRRAAVSVPAGRPGRPSVAPASAHVANLPGSCVPRLEVGRSCGVAWTEGRLYTLGAPRWPGTGHLDASVQALAGSGRGRAGRPSRLPVETPNAALVRAPAAFAHPPLRLGARRRACEPDRGPAG